MQEQVLALSFNTCALNFEMRFQHIKRKYFRKLAKSSIFREPCLPHSPINEFMEVIRKFIVQISAQIFVKLVAVSILIMITRAYQKKIGRFDSIIETHCVTRVHDHKDFLVHMFQIHLLINFSQVFRLQHFSVLNFEKVVPSVPVKINEYLRVLVSLQFLVFWIL